MSDIYQDIATSNVGRRILKSINLPVPVKLERFNPSQTSFTSGNLLLRTNPGGRCNDVINAILAKSDATVSENVAVEKTLPIKSMVFDATGLQSSADLTALHDFFHPIIKQIVPNGRIVVIATTPEHTDTPHAAIAMRALEGFTRAIGKEVKKGCTAQLIYVEPGAEALIEGPLRFTLSAKSAYVSAQVIRVTKNNQSTDAMNWDKPLANKIALVTGASRGIGEAIAATLARDGAEVICLDIPAAEEALTKVANRIKGKALMLDITEASAPEQIAEMIEREYGDGGKAGVDILVHNAGIARDKTLGNMPLNYWSSVIDINLSSEERINDYLMSKGLIKPFGSIVCVSSMGGIAGNFGQTNYATSKAGVIGMVQAFAPLYAEQNITINAVAPGFIETPMTDAMPLLTREVGRRMNSLSQGGQPEDVAETIAFFASPGSCGVTANVIRVCGQSLIGA